MYHYSQKPGQYERKIIVGKRMTNIYKRKDGRFEGRCIIAYDLTGKAKYQYVYSKTYQGVKQK